MKSETPCTNLVLIDEFKHVFNLVPYSAKKELLNEIKLANKIRIDPIDIDLEFQEQITDLISWCERRLIKQIV